MAASKPSRKPTAAPALGELVDELGALDKELAPFAGKIARVEALRKALRAAHVNAPAERPVEVTGVRFVVELGPKAEERSIDYPRLWKLAGVAVMKKIATVTLKALEGEAPAIAAQVISSAATGTRPLKIFERATP